MDDYIIRISNRDHSRTTEWEMTLNLQEIAKSAGRREWDEGYETWTVPYPMLRARKLLKVIREYGTDADFEKCNKYFAANPRLFKHWKELIG